MTLTLLPAPRPGALVAPQFDPRPCVTNDPRWWDLGNDGNARALRLCNICPTKDDDTCEISQGTIRRGQAYGDNLNRPLKLCTDCGHPRIRNGQAGNPTCHCANKNRTTAEAVEAWLNAGGDTRTVREIADEIGMTYIALKDALCRARRAGDVRVPLLSNREQVAA